MKSYEELEQQEYRAQMRSAAMDYRKAIHPDFYGDMNRRIQCGLHALGLAKSYWKLARRVPILKSPKS